MKIGFVSSNGKYYSSNVKTEGIKSNDKIAIEVSYLLETEDIILKNKNSAIDLEKEIVVKSKRKEVGEIIIFEGEVFFIKNIENDKVFVIKDKNRGREIKTHNKFNKRMVYCLNEDDVYEIRLNSQF